jgi:uncharacterized protein YcfJ
MADKKKAEGGYDVFETALDYAPAVGGAVLGGLAGRKVGRVVGDKMGNRFAKKSDDAIRAVKNTPEYQAHMRNMPPQVGDDVYNYDFTPAQRKKYDDAWGAWETRRRELGGGKIDQLSRRGHREYHTGYDTGMGGSIAIGAVGGGYAGDAAVKESKKYQITKRK